MIEVKLLRTNFQSINCILKIFFFEKIKKRLALNKNHVLNFRFQMLTYLFYIYNLYNNYFSFNILHNCFRT